MENTQRAVTIKQRIKNREFWIINSGRAATKQNTNNWSRTARQREKHTREEEKMGRIRQQNVLIYAWCIPKPTRKKREDAPSHNRVPMVAPLPSGKFTPKPTCLLLKFPIVASWLLPVSRKEVPWAPSVSWFRNVCNSAVFCIVFCLLATRPSGIYRTFGGTFEQNDLNLPIVQNPVRNKFSVDKNCKTKNYIITFTCWEVGGGWDWIRLFS